MDPLAAAGGQDSYSPYAAMGNDPVSSTDPDGLAPRILSTRVKMYQVRDLANHFWDGFSESTLAWAGLGGGYLDFRYWYNDQFGSGWRSAGSTGKVTTTFTREKMDAMAGTLAEMLPGSTETFYADGSIVINFEAGYEGGGDDNPQTKNPQNADGSDACVTSVSNEGIDFIKSWEKYSSILYDASGREHRGDWTIGWGHKVLAGEDFSKGITSEQADALFLSDLQKTAVNPILKYVNVGLNQHQFDALTSYVFNSGIGNTLIGTQLIRQLNQGNYSSAVLQIDIIKQQGHIMNGLVQRRRDEQNIWINGYYNMHK